MVHVHNICNGIGLVSWALLFSSTNKGPSSFKLCFILGWCVNYSVITFFHILLYDFFFRIQHSDPCSIIIHHNPAFLFCTGYGRFSHINNPPSAPACQMSLHFKWILKDRRNLEFIKCRGKTAYAMCMRRFVFHYFVQFFSFVQFIS